MNLLSLVILVSSFIYLFICALDALFHTMFTYLVGGPPLPVNEDDNNDSGYDTN